MELGTLRSDPSYSKSNEAAVNSFGTSSAIEEGVEPGDHKAAMCDGEEVLPDKVLPDEVVPDVKQ